MNPASDDRNGVDGAPAFSGTRPVSSGAPRQTVLVAEDSKIIRMKLAQILGTLDGVELRVAADGLEALALACALDRRGPRAEDHSCRRVR